MGTDESVLSRSTSPFSVREKIVIDPGAASNITIQFTASRDILTFLVD